MDDDSYEEVEGRKFGIMGFLEVKRGQTEFDMSHRNYSALEVKTVDNRKYNKLRKGDSVVQRDYLDLLDELDDDSKGRSFCAGESKDRIEQIMVNLNFYKPDQQEQSIKGTFAHDNKLFSDLVKRKESQIDGSRLLLVNPFKDTIFKARGDSGKHSSIISIGSGELELGIKNPTLLETTSSSLSNTTIH